MIANRFRLLYMPEDNSVIKEFFWTRARLITIASSVIALTLVLVVGIGILIARLTETHEQRSLRRENDLLMKEVSELRYGVDELKSSMETLEQTDNLLRVMVDLPPINQDVRDVGIGGSVSHDLSRPDDPAQHLMLDLDKLEREIKLQHDSFEQIRERIQDNQDLILHTPSIWPVEGGRLTSYFGKRRDPFTRRIVPHYGIDIGAKRGTPIYATADGVVKEAKRKYAFGKIVRIDHGYGFETVYGHLHSYSVSVGQEVKRGDLIATVGNTGRSTGPHLHYEIRIKGKPVNPLDFMFEGYTFAR
jgi:hypothetical protein